MQQTNSYSTGREILERMMIIGVNEIDHQKCINYNNMKVCVRCKMFYSNLPSYFENLYKEKKDEFNSNVF